MAKLDFRASSERLRLRLLEDRDLDLTRAWRNASRSWFENSSEISPAIHRAWFQSYLQDDSQIVLIAEDRISWIPVGQGAIRNFHRDPSTDAVEAEFGRLLVEPDLMGRGIATEILMAIISECRRHGILTLRLSVLSDNVPALRVYERCGFREISRTASSRPLITMIRRDWELWSFDEAERIDAFWTENAFEREYRATMAREVVKLMGTPASVLEVGCGTGQMMAELIKAGNASALITKISGCDISPAMLNKARFRFPTVPLHEADIFDLRFQDKQFDVVLSFEVLSHLPSVKKPLLEMARVAGKKLIFTVWEQINAGPWVSAGGFKPIHQAVTEKDVTAVLPGAKPIGPMGPSGIRLWEYSR